MLTLEEAGALFRLQHSRNIFEEIIAQCYTATVEPGHLVVDAGANHGLHSWPLAELVGPEGLVLAVEPIPALASALRQGAAERGLEQLRVVQAALAAQKGQAAFHWVTNADGYSGLQPRAYPLPPATQMLTVPTTTLDALLQPQSRPWRFAKLDLEGGEFHALQGATLSLARHRPLLAFEKGRDPAAQGYGYTQEEWFGFFAAQGYTLHDLFGRPFTPAEWWPEGVPWYCLATPTGGADEAALQQHHPARLRALLAAAT